MSVEMLIGVMYVMAKVAAVGMFKPHVHFRNYDPVVNPRSRYF
jgi:hypothetical protein